MCQHISVCRLKGLKRERILLQVNLLTATANSIKKYMPKLTVFKYKKLYIKSNKLKEKADKLK